MLVDHSSDIGQARDCSLKHWKRLLWGVPRFPHNHQQGVLRLDIFLHLFNDVDFQTAEEIHNIGLSEVDRIEEEMLLIVREMGWTFPHFKSDNDNDGTFIIHLTNNHGIRKTFIKCLYQLTLYLKLWGHDPPRVHWDDPNRPSQFLWLSWRCWLAPNKLNNLWSILKCWPSELLQAFHDIIEGQIDGKLLEIFHNKPKTALEIVPVRISNLYIIFINYQETSSIVMSHNHYRQMPPSQSNGPAAFYSSGTPDGSRPGI